jgi:hypothetical protein
VTKLEKLLTSSQDRGDRLQWEKEENAKTSQAATEALRSEVEILSCAKEDPASQLRDKDIELPNAKGEVTRLKDTLEWYRSRHIRNNEMLCDDMLELLGQCNLERPPTSFP